MGEVTKHYLISGRVQGVGFRAFTQRAASELSLRGWVRNLPDGRVEAMAAGNEKAIAAFETKLKIGPPNGLVEAMVVGEGTVDASLTGFAVRKDGG